MGTISRAALILASLALASVASAGGESGWGSSCLGAWLQIAHHQLASEPFYGHAHSGARAEEGWLEIVAKKYKNWSQIDNTGQVNLQAKGPGDV